MESSSPIRIRLEKKIGKIRLGDKLEEPLVGGLAKHTSIYVGNDYVVEATGGKGASSASSKSLSSEGRIVQRKLNMNISYNKGLVHANYS